MKHLLSILILVLGGHSIHAQTNNQSGRLTTRVLLADIGFNNINLENTSANSGFDQFDFQLARSSNFTFSPVGQRLNLYNNQFYLEYKAMFEFCSFRFKEDITIQDQGNALLIEELNDIKKSKLNIRYFTVPLGFTFRSSVKTKGFVRLSAGVFGGYLLGANTKLRFDDRKEKQYDDFNINEFRYGVYGKLGLGLLHVYYRYAFSPMFEAGNNPIGNMYSFGFVLGGF